MSVNFYTKIKKFHLLFLWHALNIQITIKLKKKKIVIAWLSYIDFVLFFLKKKIKKKKAWRKNCSIKPNEKKKKNSKLVKKKNKNLSNEENHFDFKS